MLHNHLCMASDWSLEPHLRMGNTCICHQVQREGQWGLTTAELGTYCRSLLFEFPA